MNKSIPHQSVITQDGSVKVDNPKPVIQQPDDIEKDFKVIDSPKTQPFATEQKNSSSGFSLVAGYSDSEEEDDELKSVFIPKPESSSATSHSTLFPIPQQLDVNDFQPLVEKPKEDITSEYESKVFQRKKRIDVVLMNTGKKKDDTPGDHENVTRGLGFSDNSSVKDKSKTYPGFEKGGVLFVKSDVLNPSTESSKNERREVENHAEPKDDALTEKLEDMYVNLVEKLGFLNSAHSAIPPTQTMVIQAEVRQQYIATQSLFDENSLL